MKPYYEKDGIVIYHGGYEDVVESVDFDVVLTDPPYGIAHPTDYRSRGRGVNAATKDFAPVHGDREPFDPQPLIDRLLPACLFGANHYASRLPDSSGWLVWDKRVQDGKGVNDQSDAELAWTNCVKGVRIFRHMWNGYWKDSERGESYHPTQKPVALMAWAMRMMPEGVVFDPFMGSGPVLIAARDLGRKAVGVEIEERYCEIAAKRLDQNLLPFGE